MSASFMRSTRAKSLLIDFLFTAISLSHGDDARSLIARRVGYDHQATRQQAQAYKLFFSIIETVVLERNASPEKTSAAYSNRRPCLAKFVWFLISSHSYFITDLQSVTRFVVTDIRGSEAGD